MPKKPTTKSPYRAGAQHIAGLKARGFKFYGQPERIEFALMFDDKDRKTGQPTVGRYERMVAALMSGFNCSRASATRTVAAARAYRMDVLADKLPGITVDLLDQFQNIADKAVARADPGDYQAAVSALREIGKIAGAYAPVKVEVEHSGHVEVALDIDVTLSVLDEEDHAALRRISEKIESARVAGLLTQTTDTDDDDDIADAEIVTPDPGGN